MYISEIEYKNLENKLTEKKEFKNKNKIILILNS